MPMLGLSFSELKKVIGIVVILLAVAFVLGFSTGYKAGRSSTALSKPSEFEPTEKQKREAKEFLREVLGDPPTSTPPPSNNSNAETSKQVEKDMDEIRDEFKKSQSETPDEKMRRLTAPSPSPPTKPGQ